MIESPVTVWLSEEESMALTALANKYQQLPEDRVWAWIRQPLDDAVRFWRAEQWDARRRAIDNSAPLAAAVDAAVKR